MRDEDGRVRKNDDTSVPIGRNVREYIPSVLLSALFLKQSREKASDFVFERTIRDLPS